jgi:hypothetical protein
MATTKFSLFDDLTNVSGSHGATALIKYLVQIISHDVCAVNRNTLSYYRLVHRVGEIYKAINALISEVEKDDVDQWDNYIKYTDAIDPLEGWLSQSFCPSMITYYILAHHQFSLRHCRPSSNRVNSNIGKGLRQRMYRLRQCLVCGSK